MAFVILPTDAPANEAAVNPNLVAAMFPANDDADNVDRVELKMAGGQSLWVKLNVGGASEMLGVQFVALVAPQSAGGATYLVNPALVSEILPNGQGVCSVYVSGAVYQAQGTLVDVLKLF